VIVHAAAGFVLVHNHPSGDARPSAADVRQYASDELQVGLRGLRFNAIKNRWGPLACGAGKDYAAYPGVNLPPRITGASLTRFQCVLCEWTIEGNDQEYPDMN
jgi:hypothetical protein